MVQKTLNLLSAGCVLALAAVSGAHEDDPKANQERTPYEGPSWRSDVDGGLAGGFDFDGIGLLANLTMPELDPGQEGADCWGYVSPSGREYALMTTTGGTSFVEITNPGNPQVIQYIDGPNCLWRDIKVFGTYCYIVSDCGGGIQVVSLQNIDSGSVTLVNTITTGGTSNTHNIAMDPDTGLIARCGGGNNLGLRFYDAAANPVSPPLVGDWTPIYVHDAQLRTFDTGPFAGQTLAYCCGGTGNGSGSTRLAVVNVTNPSNPVLLGEAYYPGSAYCHQGWLSEDGETFYVNDELYSGQSSTFIFDVSDPTDPSFVTRASNGLGSSCHNCYTKGDKLFAANYRSGLRVFDISSPYNPVEISYFDTYPSSNSSGFNGAWSVYPYFPSGTIIVSDIERGLFVLDTDFTFVGFTPSGSGGFPELVASSGQVLSVDISIEGGTLDTGSGVVLFNDGSGTQQSSLNFNGTQYSVTLPSLECPGQVSFSFGIQDTEGTLYESQVYVRTVADSVDLVVEDDFDTSAGWSAQTTASVGGWERAIPSNDSISVIDCSAPDSDADPDGNGFCWVTGNGLSTFGCEFDIDGGQTTLTSAVYDVDIDDPEVIFSWWYDNTSSNNTEFDDPFVIEISGNSGVSWTTLLTVPLGSSAQTGWTESSFLVSDYVTLTTGLRMRFTASDNDPGSVVEAGVDNFRIQQLTCGGACPVAADLNCDGSVNGIDLSLVLGNWGTNGEAGGDVNGDDNVDGQDIASVLGSWTG